MNWAELIKAFVVGGMLGAIFTLLDLPVPVPQALAGIVGIVGVYVGYLVVHFFAH